jgi:hypothetical protein
VPAHSGTEGEGAILAGVLEDVPGVGRYDDFGIVQERVVALEIEEEDDGSLARVLADDAPVPDGGLDCTGPVGQDD